MCSIVGIVNYNISKKELLFNLNKLKHRGLDSYGIYFDKKIEIKKSISEFNDEKNIFSNVSFAHSLLSLVNFLPQPITNKNKDIFISNCEIYNWEELNDKYNLNSKNDAELLFNLINKKGIENINEILNEVDGVWAFSYFDKLNNKIYLSRDLLGVKPLFFSYENDQSLVFASEKKVLLEQYNPEELDPKKILVYDLNTKKIEYIKRDFFSLEGEIKDEYLFIKNKTKELLIEAIKKRIPDKKHKIGILFSGGIDSTFIVYVLKKLGVDFTCYTAKLEGGNIEEASDLIYAKEIAKKYKFKLKIAKINVNELENEIKKVREIIEDKDHIKISVALPFYLSCKLAREDNIKVIFSGLGSEEIFAGYNRHRKVDNINQECVEGLSILHKRDLYRDDTITMSQTQELRLPFLDKELIEYSLNIPDKYKLNLDEMRSKIILRDIATEMGLAEKYSERAKKAAQYGSKFDKGIQRLAKNKGLQKQEYINRFF